MGRITDFDGEEKTPVTDITDPKRTATEAELQIAQSVIRGLRAERAEHVAEIRKLKAELSQMETANANLRAQLRRK